MQILSPKEYKEQNQDAYLDDYINYLEEIQKETEQVLENAQDFSLNDTVIEEIKTQSTKIVSILTMIERNFKEVLFRTIDTLSKEDLLEYFSSNSEERQKEIMKEEFLKKDLKEQLEEINKKIDQNLYNNGRDEKFYQAEDADDFFKEPISVQEYFSQLLSNKLTETLALNFSMALQIEGQIQNIEISDEMDVELSANFVKLLKKCQNILKYSEDAKEELIRNLYSENGIGKNLDLYFKENPYQNIVINLINLQGRKNTEFYAQLPEELQTQLILERFQGPIYQKLFETYRAYKSEKSPVNDDLNIEENHTKNWIEKTLQTTKQVLESLNREEQEEKEFLSDASAMREALKKEISKIVGDNQISTEDLEQAITEAEENKSQIIGELKTQINLLKDKQSKLELAQSILIDPDYLPFFQSVNKRNSFILYRVLGEAITEKAIEPYLETEKRRLQQIQIMCETEDQLEKLYSDIQEIIKNSNFITRRKKSYKELLENFKYEYRQRGYKCLDDLNYNHLFHVCYPLSTSREEQEKIPHTFVSLNGLFQSFDIPHGISSETKSKFSISAWESYRLELKHQQELLTTKLFDITEDVDDYYYFGITKDDRMKLLQVQTKIVEIIETEYNIRKSKRGEIEKGNISLDEEKVQVLESFLGKDSNLSQESVALFIEKSKKEIQQLRDRLLSVLSDRQFYQIFNMNMSLEIPRITSVLEQLNFNKKIKELEIDGVTTIEEASMYKIFLEEFDPYMLPKDTIKSLYLEKK